MVYSMVSYMSNLSTENDLMNAARGSEISHGSPLQIPLNNWPIYIGTFTLPVDLQIMLGLKQSKLHLRIAVASRWANLAIK